MSEMFSKSVMIIFLGILLSGCTESKQSAREEFLKILLEHGIENEFYASIDVRKSDSIKRAYVEIYDLWKGLKEKGDTNQFLSILSGNRAIKIESTFQEDLNWIGDCQEVKRVFLEKGEEAIEVYFYEERVQKRGLIQSNQELGCLIDELYSRNYIIYREDESGMLGIISTEDFKDHLESIPPE